MEFSTSLGTTLTNCCSCSVPRGLNRSSNKKEEIKECLQQRDEVAQYSCNKVRTSTMADLFEVEGKCLI